MLLTVHHLYFTLCFCLVSLAPLAAVIFHASKLTSRYCLCCPAHLFPQQFSSKAHVAQYQLHLLAASLVSSWCQLLLYLSIVADHVTLSRKPLLTVCPSQFPHILAILCPRSSLACLHFALFCIDSAWPFPSFLHATVHLLGLMQSSTRPAATCFDLRLLPCPQSRRRCFCQLLVVGCFSISARRRRSTSSVTSSYLLPAAVSSLHRSLSSQLNSSVTPHLCCLHSAHSLQPSNRRQFLQLSRQIFFQLTGVVSVLYQPTSARPSLLDHSTHGLQFITLGAGSLPLFLSVSASAQPNRCCSFSVFQRCHCNRCPPVTPPSSSSITAVGLPSFAAAQFP